MTTRDIDAAYRACEAITATQAKNFSYGIRLLPTPKRHAMSALYALARRIDDISDGGLPVDQKRIELARLQGSVHDRVAGGAAPGDDAVLLAIGDAFARYPIPLGAIDDLIRGCELDCSGTTYETIDELVEYCRLVAGSVGRLSVAVFGTTARPSTAEPMADALGVALQLTNILRDVIEDRGMGRVYLPAEDLDRFGCKPDASGPPDSMAAVVLFEAMRAREWYRQGLQLLPLLDRRSRACVTAMAGIYRRLLTTIEREPEAVLVRRVSVSSREKVWVAARSLAGAGV
ncbi:MAG: phytoene/squalene synthase family protein [Acidimicrobiales bacterium]